MRIKTPAEISQELNGAFDFINEKATSLGFELPRETTEYRQRTIESLMSGGDKLSSYRFRLYSPVWGSESSVEVQGKYKNSSTTISWSSTARTIPMAIVCIENYQKYVQLASFIEALLS